jgi:hypothetical protein
MSRLLVVGLSLVMLAACNLTPDRPRGSGEADRTGGPRVHLATTAAASGGSVAEYFSPPRPFPGPTWTRNGRRVDGRELNSIAGPDHCGWERAVMMHLGWPLGTVSRTAGEIRQFIRDPGGVIDARLRDEFATGIDLPADARDTGYRNGELQLWLSPSHPDTAYLRVGDDVEGWPRADPVVACA